MENGPFIDGLPFLIAWWIFPWRTVSHNQMINHRNIGISTFTSLEHAEYLTLAMLRQSVILCHPGRWPWPLRSHQDPHESGGIWLQLFFYKLLLERIFVHEKTHEVYTLHICCLAMLCLVSIWLQFFCRTSWFLYAFIHKDRFFLSVNRTFFHKLQPA